MKEEKRKGARARTQGKREDERDERDEKAYEDPYEDLRSSANKLKIKN
jgi:hypothetical protein